VVGLVCGERGGGGTRLRRILRIFARGSLSYAYVYIYINEKKGTERATGIKRKRKNKYTET
jgi:hypothetical protein